MNLAGIPEPRPRRRKGTTAKRAQDRAAVYVRVSTDAQSDEGGSLESQERACRALCEARGWEVAGVYVDAGESGGSLERPALAELRCEIRAGRVGVVVVYALDRLSRSQRDTLALLDEWAEQGAGLQAASQSFDTVSPTGRAMLGMLAVFAELQRAEIRERTRAELRRKTERGEAVGRTPFGLRRDGLGFAVEPDEWVTVARILTLRGEGATCQAIADTLNADGVPTSTATRGERRGRVSGPGGWHPATVAKLCRNPNIRAAAASLAASADGTDTPPVDADIESLLARLAGR